MESSKQVSITTVEAISEAEEKKQRCPYCESDNVYGMSRVVGYFSRVDNWQASKKAEFKKRQKGNYTVKD